MHDCAVQSCMLVVVRVVMVVEFGVVMMMVVVCVEVVVVVVVVCVEVEVDVVVVQLREHPNSAPWLSVSLHKAGYLFTPSLLPCYPGS